MLEAEFVKILKEDGSYDDFRADWETQLAGSDYDGFENYQPLTFSILEQVIDTNEKKSGAYALKIKGQYLAICQLNVAMIPGYTGSVLRLRFLTLCPAMDVGSSDIDYADAITTLLMKTEELARNDETMSANHIKFHLSSPADRDFFSMLGKGLRDFESYKQVDFKGSWLYITLEQAN
jgi:hypothetical protein